MHNVIYVLPFPIFFRALIIAFVTYFIISRYTLVFYVYRINIMHRSLNL